MSDRQVHDEAITLFLAGHETTSNALTWTWWLLLTTSGTRSLDCTPNSTPCLAAGRRPRRPVRSPVHYRGPVGIHALPPAGLGDRPPGDRGPRSRRGGVSRRLRRRHLAVAPPSRRTLVAPANRSTRNVGSIRTPRRLVTPICRSVAGPACASARDSPGWRPAWCSRRWHDDGASPWSRTPASICSPWSPSVRAPGC